MKPLTKTPAIVAALNDISRVAYGMSFTDAIAQNICVSCKAPTGEFRDAVSTVEYTITGLCQECQDEVFAPMEED